MPKGLAHTSVWVHSSELAYPSVRYPTACRTILGDRQIAAAKAPDVTGFVAPVNGVHVTDMQLQRLVLEGGFANSSPCTAIF